MNPDEGFLFRHGNYQALKAFQKAEVVYDLTVRFTRKYLARGDRTIDQMVQAARSGKKNLLEGSKAAKNSKEMEIKLTNVARASLEELLDDYRDYLRSADAPAWDKDSKEALYVRRLGTKQPQSFDLYRKISETRPPEVVANVAVCLVNQANYLIDRLVARLEKDFLQHGGLRERMTRARLEQRAKQDGTHGPHRPCRTQKSHPNKR